MVDAQRHARWALLAAGVFAVAAPIAAVVPHDTGPWLPLHLFVVGALLCAISGATQMLAVTWSTAPAPRDAVARAQLALVVLGAVGVVVGRELDAYAVVALGAACSAGGLVVLAGVLLWVRHRSSTGRFGPALHGYLVATIWGVTGVTLGALAAHGGDIHTVRIVEAHLTVNLFGLVGTVVLATLPYFAATQLRTKMSPAATPARLRSVIGCNTAAVLLVAAGELVDRRWLVSVGFVGVAAAVVATVALLPRPTRRQFDFAGQRLVGLGCGLLWWVVCTGLLAAEAADVAVVHSDVVPALVVGAYAQILVASLAYLAPVVRAGGHERLGAGFRLMKSWPGVLAANLAAALLLCSRPRAAWVVLVLWALDTGVRGVLLLRPQSNPPARGAGRGDPEGL